MPIVTIHCQGQAHRESVPARSNLVVRAGIRQFPFPHLQYRCGMGQCGRCAARILAGAEALPAPNWKEERVLGERLAQGWRLPCQLWLEHDLELTQEADPAAGLAPT